VGGSPWGVCFQFRDVGVCGAAERSRWVYLGTFGVMCWWGVGVVEDSDCKVAGFFFWGGGFDLFYRYF